MCCKKLLELHFEERKYICTRRSFLVINVCNQGKTLCSPCTYTSMYVRTNRSYNERGSRTNYVRSSIPPCISRNTSLEKLPNCKTKKNTLSSMEQKGSFLYSQQPTIRPYIVSDESNLYKMHFHTMLQAPKQSLPVRFHYYVIPYSTVLSEKLTVPQPVKKLPPFYGTRRFITALTSARHLSLSWARARFMTEI